jgi:dolichol-phosphate mannosyltransferase
MINVIDISIVVPVYNEEGNIYPFIDRIKKSIKDKLTYEVIFCADPSTDNTDNILKKICKKNTNLKTIFFSRRFGQPMAVMAGILNCKGKTCVIIDVDLQDPPELIPMLYKKFKDGYDVVYAKRKTRKGETLVKKIITFLGYKLINKIARVEIPKNTGDFRIISRKVIEELRKLPETHGFLRGLIAIIGYKQTSIEYDREKRLTGNGNYNRFFGSLKIGFNGIISFSSFLLTLNLLAGILIAFSSFLIVIWIIINKLFYNTDYALGIPTIIVLITFIGGVQLIAIGILGEYIGRIYDEVKNRPRFIIDHTLNLSKIIDDGSKS